MTEKTIETYLVKQVKQMGGKAIKLNPIGMVGLPDRMVLLPKGIMFFVETKAPGKKARPVQLSVHKQLQKLGFDIYVIDNKTQIKEVLKKYGEIQAT